MAFGNGREPAWPLLAQGFLGSLVGDTDVRKLGFESTAGSPVFDARGVLVGITVASTPGQATWLPLVSAMPARAATTPASAAVAVPGLVAPDEIYEAGMRRTLQVLVEPR